MMSYRWSKVRPLTLSSQASAFLILNSSTFPKILNSSWNSKSDNLPTLPPLTPRVFFSSFLDEVLSPRDFFSSWEECVIYYVKVLTTTGEDQCKNLNPPPCAEIMSGEINLHLELFLSPGASNSSVIDTLWRLVGKFPRPKNHTTIESLRRVPSSSPWFFPDLSSFRLTVLPSTSSVTWGKNRKRHS